MKVVYLAYVAIAFSIVLTLVRHNNDCTDAEFAAVNSLKPSSGMTPVQQDALQATASALCKAR